MDTRKGKFISFEGLDNCGKGTQIAKAVKYLDDRGINSQVMREPGGTPYGEAIRAFLIDPKAAFEALFEGLKSHPNFRHFEKLAKEARQPEFDLGREAFCELFLLLASRAQFCVKVRELLDSGENVIADRFADSSAAYQGGGHRLGVKAIDQLNPMATGGLWPEKTFFIDISVQEMHDRMAKERPEKPLDYFEQKYPADFFERVREAYLSLQSKNPSLIIKIDGSLPPDEVFEEIKPHLDRIFDAA